mmetsp:Transcript_45787/g.46435  ORF Transcript_45787/g.46435 Transcript_45787/m.46435 type:complete len:143 (+) Transcript_45787:919-1347(+)
MKPINKLITYKPNIKAEAAKAKSNKELADKVYGNKGTKRNNNGTPRVAKADKTTCKTCGKKHKGDCWKSKSGGKDKLTCSNNGKPFDKTQMKFINQMFQSHSATKADSDSDSEKVSTGWKKSINTVHQMYITQQYRQDNGMD